jgi:hypothetical protein
MVDLGAAERNGVVKSKRTRKPTAAASAKGSAPVRRWLTLGMGCGIPCLSLSLSSIGGRLLEQGHAWLGAGALVLCCCVLTVSLSHLAWAIQDIIRSARWQGWALAIAVDLSLVLGELSRVAGFDLWVVPALMFSVTVASAVLNCWAFLRGGR